MIVETSVVVCMYGLRGRDCQDLGGHVLTFVASVAETLVVVFVYGLGGRDLGGDICV